MMRLMNSLGATIRKMRCMMSLMGYLLLMLLGRGQDTAQIVWRQGDRPSGVSALAFSPDGQLLASGGWSEIRLWRMSNETQEYTNWVTRISKRKDFTDLREVRTLVGHKGWVYAVAFSPDGRLLASGGVEGVVYLWELPEGRQMRVWQGHEGTVCSLAFSPDGQLLASAGGDGTVRLWRVSDGALMRVLHGHTGAIRTLAFSPDGQLLATGGEDKTIRLWRPSMASRWEYFTGTPTRSTAWRLPLMGSFCFRGVGIGRCGCGGWRMGSRCGLMMPTRGWVFARCSVRPMGGGLRMVVRMGRWWWRGQCSCLMSKHGSGGWSGGFGGVVYY